MILDWKKFVLRSDIKNLPLEEQRRKFLSEQLYHDNLLSEQKQRQYEFYMSQMQSKGNANGVGFSGQGVDGPIAGATVTSNVGTTTTNAVGVFKFSKKPSGPITLTGGTDSITGVAFEGELIGYPEYKTISPITTVAHHLKEQGSLTIEKAIDQVFKNSTEYFGIELPDDSRDIILQKDYIQEAIVNNNRAGIAAQAVTTYLEGVTETLGASLATSAGDGSFQKGDGKKRSYRAIGRQIALDNKLDPSSLNQRVQYTSTDKRGTPINEEGFGIPNIAKISAQLTMLKTGLREQVNNQQYTTNYLTTQIQALNLAQKTTIKSEINSVVGSGGSFTNLEEVRENVKSDLKQIESGKTNETKQVVDSTRTDYSVHSAGFTQIDSKGNPQKFSTSAFSDNTQPSVIAYFGSRPIGSTLFKATATKLGTAYYPIIMNVSDEKETTAESINPTEYVQIAVSDSSKNLLTITAKPQPQIDKSSKATLSLTSISKREVSEEEDEATDHIVTGKDVSYTIAQDEGKGYGVELSNGIVRGGVDIASNLPKLTITTFTPYEIEITENYDEPAKGENAVGKEVFTVKDTAKGGIGVLTTTATFEKDEDGDAERLIFKLTDSKGNLITYRITYTIL